MPGLSREGQAKDTGGVGVQREVDSLGCRWDLSFGDEVFQHGRMLREVSVAQGIDLVPVEFDGAVSGPEVEEGEDGGAVRVEDDPGLAGAIAQALNVHGSCGNAGLVDGDEVAVGDEGEVVRVHVGEVGTEVERRAGDGPQNEHGLALCGGDAVLCGVAQFEGVKVVPAAGFGVGNPGADVGEAVDDSGPLGQVALDGGVSTAAAGVALDVVFDPPSVGVGAPERGLVDGELVGEFEPDRTPGVDDGGVP